MGIAWLLLRRTFAGRPKRTILFLIGYALATAVMITLLSVGEAVLLQAQDKDLLGGGDLILVPQGIDVESLKVGGIQAMYYTIPQARFVTRQVLGSTRFGKDIDTVSPYQFSRLLYARKVAGRETLTAYAQGSLPDEEFRMRNAALPWRNNPEDKEYLHPTPENFYHDIDRFHLPATGQLDMSRWAEWHYFNFEAGNFHGYLSIMVAGDVTKNQAQWIVSLQLMDESSRRLAAVLPASMEQLPLQRIDYSTGASRVRFVKDHYEIELAYKDKDPVSGVLRYYPKPNLYFPPAYLARSENFESGYVIPSLRGTYTGQIQVGKQVYDFAQASGYHDHNWGIWQQPDMASGKSGAPVSWNWGHAFARDYALFYGEIFLQGKTKGLFLGVFDNAGFVTMFRPDAIVYSDPSMGPQGILAPSRLRISQNKAFTEIDLTGISRSFVASDLGPESSLHFVQYKMDFETRLKIDGRDIHFPARGNAETFVP